MRDHSTLFFCGETRFLAHSGRKTALRCSRTWSALRFGARSPSQTALKNIVSQLDAPRETLEGVADELSRETFSIDFIEKS